MFYVGADGNVHHVYWDPTSGGNQPDQWTTDAQAVSNLATLVAGAQQHVFYVSRDGNVHHVYWDPTAGINADQWTSDGQAGRSWLRWSGRRSPAARVLRGRRRQRAPRLLGSHQREINADQWTTDGQAVSNLATLVAGAQQHVFYVSRDGNVHHVYWDPTAGINADQWTQRRPGRQGAGHAGGPGVQQHVFYVGADGNVHHVYWDPTSGEINADQWTSDAQAVSNLATLVAGAQQHVFYTGSDKNVHHVYWDPAATGIIANLWTIDGQAAGPLATLLTG